MPKVTPLPTGTHDPPPDQALYHQDEHARVAAQVAALTNGRLNRLDRTNLIEYLTEITIRDRRELRSRLVVLLLHLLKCQFQPGRPTRGWVTTILEQQSEIRSLLDSIPSLGRQADILAASAYPDAIRRAAHETGLPAARFPATSPWTVDAALAFDPPEPASRGQRHP